MQLSLLAGILASGEAPARSPDQGFWANMGSGDWAGRSGMFTLDHAEGRDLVIGQGFGYSPGCWRAFRHQPESGDYRQVHGEPPSVGLGYNPMRTVTVGDVDPRPGKEIVVGIWEVAGDSKGTVEIHDGMTKKLIRSFRVSDGSQNYGLESLLTHDLDGDGRDEILLNAGRHVPNGIMVMRGDGTFWWSCPSPGNGIVIGQLDEDPAMELAGTDGKVIDLGLRAEQWSGLESGTGVLVHDVDGDGVGELIHFDKWDGVFAVDIRTGRKLWHFLRPDGISAVLIDDIDADGIDELVVGDAQWGGLHVLRMGEGTPQELYQIDEPGYDPNRSWTSSGTAGLLLADPDSDGRKELVWCYGGRGGVGQGPSQIFIYDPIARAFEWISPWRAAPNGAPQIGDVTGDGEPDLVTTDSEGGILVYDAARLALLNPPKLAGERPGFSDGVTTGLVDVDGDGRMEIAVADNRSLRVLKFHEGAGFEEIWRSADQVFQGQYQNITICDVEADGALEVVVTRRDLAWIDPPDFVQVFDFQSGRLKWSSADLLPKIDTFLFTSSVVSSLIKDADGDGHLEIVVALSYGHLAIIDLATHELEAYDGETRYSLVLDVPGGPSFLVLEHYKKDYYTATVGDLHEVTLGPEGYELDTRRSFGEFGLEIKAMAPAPQDRWWVITKWRVGLLAPDGSWDWQSERYEDLRTAFAFLDTARGPELYVGWIHGILGFKIGHLFQKPRIRVEATHAPSESGRQGQVIFSRDDAGVGPSRIRFTLAGTAKPGVDFTLAGALDDDGDGVWEFELNDSSDRGVTFYPVGDVLAEGDETVVIQVLEDPSFVLAVPGPVEFVVEDDEPRLSVRTLKGEASESAKGGLEFLVERSGNLAVQLAANFRVGGTADSKDFTALDRALQFKAGEHSLKLRFVAKADRVAEAAESVTVELEGGAAAWVNPAAATSTGWILDGQPTVRLAGTRPLQGGVEVLLATEGGAVNRSVVKLQIESLLSDGGTSNKVVSVKVGTGPQAGRYLVKSGKSAARVTVTLSNNAAYHQSGAPQLVFDLPALGR
jgi:outer membrane protein assembly factor BamB